MTLVDEILDDTPIGYWQMSEDYGIPRDSSGNNWHMRMVSDGQLSRATDAVIGSAVVVPTTSALRIIDVPAFTAATYEMWARITSPTSTVAGGVQPISGTGGQIRWYTTGGYVHVVGGFNTPPYTDMFDHTWLLTSDTDADDWHHYAWWWDGTDAALLIDGVSVATSSASFTPVAHDIVLGPQSSNIHVAHLAIYDYALTGTRLAAHYTQGLPDNGALTNQFLYPAIPANHGATRYWRCNDNTATAPTDAIDGEDATLDSGTASYDSFDDTGLIALDVASGVHSFSTDFGADGDSWTLEMSVSSRTSAAAEYGIAGTDFDVNITEDTVLVSITDDVTTVTMTATIDKQWHHLCIAYGVDTFGDADAWLIVDGVEEDSTPVTRPFTPPSTMTTYNTTGTLNYIANVTTFPHGNNVLTYKAIRSGFYDNLFPAVVTATDSPLTEVITDTPVAYWQCGDATEDAPLDEIATAHMTLIDAGAGFNLYADGLFTSLDLSRGAEVSMPVSPDADEFVVEFWLPLLFDGAGIVLQSVGANDDVVVTVTMINSYDLELDVTVGAVSTTATVEIDTFNLTYVAVKFDSEYVRTYVNEAMAGIVPLTGPITPNTGFGLTGSTQIAHIAVYDVALTDERLLAHYRELVPDSIDPIALVGTVDPITFELASYTMRRGTATLPTPSSSYPTPEDAPGWESTIGEPVSVRKELLDGAVFWSVKVPKTWAQKTPITDEVVITRNGHVHAKGPIVTKQATGSEADVMYDGRGPEWYFLRRVFGSAQRVNMLTNHDFEDGMSSWANTGQCAVTIREDGKAARGKKYANIQSWVAGDNFLDQTFVHDNTQAIYGHWFYAKAWFNIENFVDAAYNTYGLIITYHSGDVYRASIATIDASTPRGQWLPIEAKVISEPAAMGVVSIRLYAIQGSISWDSVQVVGNNFTGGKYVEGMDQTLMAREIVRYAQKGRGKSDLGIGANTPLTGIKYKGVFYHTDHQIILDGLRLVSDHDKGFDQEWKVTTGATTYTTHYPRRGGSFGTFSTSNTLDYEIGWDGSEAASAVAVQGPGDGPAREEGGDIDDGAFGGKILDKVIQAPQEAPISILDPKAKDEVRRGRELPFVCRVKIKGDQIDNIEVGDIGTVNIGDHGVTLNKECRVTLIDIDCVTDTAWVEMSQWIPPEEEE